MAVPSGASRHDKTGQARKTGYRGEVVSVRIAVMNCVGEVAGFGNERLVLPALADAWAQRWHRMLVVCGHDRPYGNISAKDGCAAGIGQWRARTPRLRYQAWCAVRRSRGGMPWLSGKPWRKRVTGPA